MTELARVTSSQMRPDGVEVKDGAAWLRVTALSPFILRVQAGPGEDNAPENLDLAPPERAGAGRRQSRSPAGASVLPPRPSGSKSQPTRWRCRFSGRRGPQTMAEAARCARAPDPLSWAELRRLAATRRTDPHLRPRRQIRRAGPARARVRQLEHRQLSMAGIDRSALQVDPVFSWAARRGGLGFFPRQHLAQPFRFRRRGPQRALFGGEGGALDYYVIAGRIPSR